MSTTARVRKRKKKKEKEKENYRRSAGLVHFVVDFGPSSSAKSSSARSCISVVCFSPTSAIVVCFCVLRLPSAFSFVFAPSRFNGGVRKRRKGKGRGEGGGCHGDAIASLFPSLCCGPFLFRIFDFRCFFFFRTEQNCLGPRLPGFGFRALRFPLKSDLFFFYFFI